MHFQWGDTYRERGFTCLEGSCGIRFAVVGGNLRELVQLEAWGRWTVAGFLKHPEAR